MTAVAVKAYGWGIAAGLLIAAGFVLGAAAAERWSR